MAEPNRVTVGAHEYSIDRMSVFDQAEVARRMSTVMVSLAMMKASGDKSLGPDAFATAILTLSRPIPQPDWDWSVNKCLSLVRRREGDSGWQPFLNRTTGEPQYADVTLPQLMELVWNVVEEQRIPDFFSRALATSDPKAQG